MKFYVILNASDKDFAEQLKSALGLQGGDHLEIVTPQFDRTDGRTITYFPRTEREFDALRELSDDALMAIGCGLWGDGHWLYPHEWYQNIPAGYLVVSILGEIKPFIPGETDDDVRFGCLAYGFKKEAK